jgi:hypothetical protein
MEIRDLSCGMNTGVGPAGAFEACSLTGNLFYCALYGILYGAAVLLGLPPRIPRPIVADGKLYIAH